MVGRRVSFPGFPVPVFPEKWHSRFQEKLAGNPWNCILPKKLTFKKKLEQFFLTFIPFQTFLFQMRCKSVIGLFL
jgi:hypothetical protein